MEFSRTSTARVATDRPARYGKQLASHMSRKITTPWDDASGSGSLTFNRDGQTTGAAELTSEPGFLILTLHSNDDHLERLEDVIGRHLVRFGKRAKKEEDRKRLARLKRSGNPAKVAAALEEESRAAANRVSRTPRKIKDVGSPRWYAPAMVTLLITGLLWVVVTYLFKGQYPIPYFVAHHQTDWLVNGNLYVGFVIMMAGFLGLLNWK